MALQCGIVGLPNVGKSTIFNALTKSHNAETANYPFCTIDPNVGVVEVPDQRFDTLVDMVQPKKHVPAAVEFVDIAGLVAGASKGEGLGNKFLAHIRQVDAILHVVRCFEDEEIIRTTEALDPINDIEVIELELVLSDLEQVDNALSNLAKRRKGGDEEAVSKSEVLEKVLPTLKEGKLALSTGLKQEEKNLIKDMALLTLKPMLFVGNVNEDYIAEPEKAPAYQKLMQYAKERNALLVPISGKIEAELTQLEPEEEKDFLADLGLEKPGLNRVIRAAYNTLGYATFFTAGEQEVRAWNIVAGISAPEAAAEIHTDIQKGFIRAEVTSYEDAVEASSLKKAQEAGKMRLEGKEYIVKDGDIVYFRFNI